MSWNYKEKTVDIEGDTKMIPVLLICCTCGDCYYSQPYQNEDFSRPETAMFCRLHDKQVDHWENPCDDFK